MHMRHARPTGPSWIAVALPLALSTLLISGAAVVATGVLDAPSGQAQAPDLIVPPGRIPQHYTDPELISAGEDLAAAERDARKNAAQRLAEEKAKEKKAAKQTEAKKKAAAEKKRAAEEQHAANNSAETPTTGSVAAGTRDARATILPETGVLDTASRSAVRDAFRTRVAQHLVDEPQPQVSGCTVAPTSNATRERALSAVNFSRALVGLSPVTFSADYNERSEQAALVQHIQGFLSHSPTDGDCDLPVGVRTSGEANLSMGTHGARNILAYLEDSGDNNAPVGHRKHILNPGQQEMGIGFAGQYGALYVFGETSSNNPTPEWIPWPSAGYFPTDMEPQGRWSITTTQRDVDFSAATVTVTQGSTSRTADIIYRDAGNARYGDQAGVTFTVPESMRTVTADGEARITVTLSGVRSQSGTLPEETYTVVLFNAH